MNTEPKPVRIDERLIHRIGVREWGLPSICMPGKIWRSKDHGTITCMLAHEDPSKVKLETLPLFTIPAGESMSEMPDHWRAALWEYVQAWPHSGMCYGPFLALTEAQRCDFVRKMAAELVKSDNIGCCSIADDIGMFAAYGYELPEKKSPKSLNEQILAHLQSHPPEHKRSMSGLIATTKKEPDEIRSALEYLIRAGKVKCVGNGKRRAWIII